MAIARLLCAFCAFFPLYADAALNVDLSSRASIKSAAKLIAQNLMSYYHGDEPGQTPGILPGPPPAGDYYWWEGGALWGTMIDYWSSTSDDTYNPQTIQSLIFQSNTPSDNYMPPNWTASLGNDDQGFWGMSALLAAELKFQNPPPTAPQWLTLAQGVFNTQAHRWDTTYCGGGLRWQIPLSNNGYNYKNSISNAIFFNMAARLARYTGNSTYAEWAARNWDWTAQKEHGGVGYIDERWNIFDGAHVQTNCTDVNRAQFSYTAAIFLQGAGFMWDFSGKNLPALWETRLLALANRTMGIFFPGGIMTEVSCELPDRVQCTTDMLSFKGYVHRFLAQTAQMAPPVRDIIMPVLRTSARGMAKSCTAQGVCGFRWNTGKYDGHTGAGQQMNALGALIGLLVDKGGNLPVTNSTGGTSRGDAGAGGNPSDQAIGQLAELGDKDRAGAAILTGVVLLSWLVVLGWMVSGINEGPKERVNDGLWIGLPLLESLAGHIFGRGYKPNQDTGTRCCYIFPTQQQSMVSSIQPASAFLFGYG
ncbi:mannan endo-1,6-alpha-mannosidase [Rhypophila decipiens]